MQFNSIGNGQGLVQDVLFLTRSTTASYPLADITRNVNQEYHNVNRLIWDSADDWHYDDTNQTDLPVSTTNLVHNQQDYSVPSTAQRIRRVEIKDSNGNYVKLFPILQEDIDISIKEYMEEAGLPQYYDLVDNSIYLFPKPSSAYCTTTSGMDVYFDRDIVEFTTASTTASPGFATPFHRLLSLQAAIDFTEDNNRMNLWMSEKSNLVDGLKKFYSTRSLEEKGTIRPAGRRFWQQYL